MNSSACNEKFKNWESLDFEYYQTMKRLDAMERFEKRRDLDDLDVEEELRLSNP